jgi:hypothetical protein
MSELGLLLLVELLMRPRLSLVWFGVGRRTAAEEEEGEFPELFPLGFLRNC